MLSKNTPKLLLAFLAATFLNLIPAFAIPDRPEPQRLVNDFAGIFSAGQIERLESMLVAFDDTTSNQILIVTVKDLEGHEAAEYATRIGLSWGVGSAEFDNGIVVLLKPRTETYGEVFISIGYGLEGVIPDAYVKRIINEEMIPFLAEEQYFDGVWAACEVLMKLASGEISTVREYEEDDGGLTLIICLIIIIIFIVIAISSDTNSGGGTRGSGGKSGRHIYMGPIGGSSWGGSSGGGVSGGFGGFGGGSFGGGGAGGRF